ncbi:MAG: riboflavin synthase [Polyangiaceae bacterium]|nr:riboflavin synthase [Polyangiaceae bacterium]
MFTGLVEDVGKLRSQSPRGPGARLAISTKIAPLVLGESIAVMGVCLTVQTILRDGFEADASGETLARSTLGRLPVGHGVHVERAMQLGGRLGGHIVSGHVDGLARLVERVPLGEALDLTFTYEPTLAAFVAEKGSVALNGVSLTINEVKADRFHVVVVPHTQGATLLGDMRAGDWANMEVDVLARYVSRWMEVRGAECGSRGHGGPATNDESLLSRLASAGYL